MRNLDPLLIDFWMKHNTASSSKINRTPYLVRWRVLKVALPYHPCLSSARSLTLDRANFSSIMISPRAVRSGYLPAHIVFQIRLRFVEAPRLLTLCFSNGVRRSFDRLELRYVAFPNIQPWRSSSDSGNNGTNVIVLCQDFFFVFFCSWKDTDRCASGVWSAR